MSKTTDTIDLRIAKRKYIGAVKINMFCPACKARLHMMNGAECYQTLEEHVDEPDEKPILKPVFKCLTADCPVNLKTGAYYGIDGSLYRSEIHNKEYQEAIGGLSYHASKDLWKQNKPKKERK